MDIKKRITALFLIPVLTIALILSDVKRTQAVVEWVVPSFLAYLALETNSDYQSFYDQNIDKYRESNTYLMEKIGFPSLISEGISDTSAILNSFVVDPVQAYRYWFQSKNNNQNITDSQCKEGLYNMYHNCHIGDNNTSFTFSDDLKDFLLWQTEQIINTNGYIYVYSHSIQKDSNIGTSLEWIREKLINYQTDSICTMGTWGDSVGLDVIPMNNVIWVYNTGSTALVYATPYSSSTLQSLAGQSVEHQYFWGGRNSTTYQQKTENTTFNNTYTFNTNHIGNAFDSSGQLDTWDEQGYYVFANIAQFNGVSSNYIGKPTYYETNTYNDFKNSGNTTYTIDSHNVNRTSYTTINNYMDEYKREHDIYPSPEDIKIYVDVENPSPNPTPTPNPDNPSGGGSSSSSATATANNQGVNVTVNNNHSINFTVPSLSGNGTSSGGTVSGNGSGSSNFFDWLGNLGSIIGNLIKGIGEALVRIFEGVAEAVTTIMESIPNILSPLMEFVFGGLPDEIKALMTLGITCVIFVGVIKAIKR